MCVGVHKGEGWGGGREREEKKKECQLSQHYFLISSTLTSCPHRSLKSTALDARSTFPLPSMYHRQLLFIFPSAEQSVLSCVKKKKKKEAPSTLTSASSRQKTTYKSET